MDLIKPKEIEIKDLDGESYTFIISRLPAIAGREVIAKYTGSNMPKVGDYASSEEIMTKLMSYVEVVRADGTHQQLKTKALINNFVHDTEMLIKLEMEMFKYNTSFLQNGKLLKSSKTWTEKLQSTALKILSKALQQ